MADRFWVGGTSTSWGASANWSASSGGAGSAGVPTAADAVFFDGAAVRDCVVDTSIRNCLTLNFTGFTRLITMTNAINAAGSVTLSPTMTVAGGSGITNSTTGSVYTANGFQWPNGLTFTGASTFTMADPWTCNGLIAGAGVGTTTTTINGSTITVNTNFTNNYTAAGFVAGTTEIIMVGTGSIILGGTTTTTRLPITINTAGTITLPASNFFYGVGTFKYITGTVVTTGNAFIVNGSASLDTDGITWNNVTFNGASATVTLLSDMLVNGNLNVGSTTNPVTVNGAFNIITRAAVNFTNTTGNITGSATIEFTRTQTVTKTAGSGDVLCHMLVNSTGTVTFVGDLRVQLNFFQGIDGVVITPDGTWTEFGGGGGETSHTFVG